MSLLGLKITFQSQLRRSSSSQRPISSLTKIRCLELELSLSDACLTETLKYAKSLEIRTTFMTLYDTSKKL